MRLASLSVRDFLSFGPEARVDFSRLGSPILVEGFVDSEESSNGAGKSSLFEALYWCLSGRTIRGVAAADVVRLGAKSCQVVAEFEHGGSEYKVARLYSAAKKALLVSVDGELEEFHDSRQGTERLFELLGLPPDVFAMACFTGRSFSTFSRMQPRERADLIGLLAKDEKWAKAAELAKRRAGALEWDRARAADRASSLKAEAARYEEKAADADAELASVREERVKRIEEIERRLKTRRDEKTAAEADVAELGERPDNPRPDTEALDAEAAAARSDEEKALEDKGKAESASRRAASGIAKVEREQDEAEAELKRLCSARDTGDCPECGQPLPEDEKAAARRTARIEELEGKLKVLASERRPALEAAREDEDGRAVKAASAAAAAEKRRLDAERRKSAALAKFVETSNAEDAKDKLRSAARTRLSDLAARVAKGEALLAAEREGGEEEGRLKAAAAHHREEAERRRGESEAAASDAARLASEVDAASYWAAGFKDIRYSVFNRTVEVLRGLVEAYCAAQGLDFERIEITTWKKTTTGKDRPQVNLYVWRSGARLSLDGLSEGEAQRVNLSCFFAVGALLEKTSGRTFDLRILDEPLTGLDSDGKQRVFQLLAEAPGQVVVIDHDSHFKSRFESVVRVAKEGGVSRVEDG